MRTIQPVKKARDLPQKFSYYEDRNGDPWLSLEAWLHDRPGTLVELCHKGFYMCKILYRGAFIIVPDDDSMVNALREATERIEKMEKL